MTTVRRPPPDRPPRPLFRVLPAGTKLVRIFNPKPYGTTALTFRTFGPLERFDHQKRKARLPCDNPARGIYYAGFSLSCCVVETFSETGLIECGDYVAAQTHLTRRLRLLDLRGNGAMRAGSIAALTSVPSRRLSQAWSRFFYETPIFKNPDGLLYHNAHNGEESVALYERAADALTIAPADCLPLGDPALRTYLQAVAVRSNLDGPFT